MYNLNYILVVVIVKKIVIILYSKFFFIFIFMVIIIINGLFFCICVLWVISIFFIILGMGVSIFLEKFDSFFDFRYDGMGRVRLYLFFYKVVKINFNEEIGGKIIMIILIFIFREGSFVVRLCCY